MTREKKEEREIREVTRAVYMALLLDVWPNAAGIVDFGLKTDTHYGALQFAVKVHEVSIEELDAALGNGPALTALIRKGNPYQGVQFRTHWDAILGYEGEPGDSVPCDDPKFGRCPTCGRNDGYLNLGREHWFKCDEHGLKWWGGENLFSTWRDETSEIWKSNDELLGDYLEVEPLLPGD